MDIKKSLYTRLGKSSENLTIASSSDDDSGTLPKKKAFRNKKSEKHERNGVSEKNLDSNGIGVGYEKKKSAYGVFTKWKNAYVRFGDKSDEENEKLNEKNGEKPKNNYFR
ncbi:unnamed protein product [Enterobius vermicularis]|uniref:Uncharacterized protein n=1 Tax=Enterobius vermicularis TaxID=51028 RepID=A0A0N4VGH9_ENTVE|nr:unnamed protein product [Enterobius vermicularis]